MGVMNELIDKGTVLRLHALLRQADTSRSWTSVEESADRVNGLQLRARSDLVAAAILSDNSSPLPERGDVTGDDHESTHDAPADGRESTHDNPADGRGSTYAAVEDEHGSTYDVPAADPEATYDRLATTVRRALLSPELSGWMVWPVSEAVTSAALLAWSNDGTGDSNTTDNSNTTDALNTDDAGSTGVHKDIDIDIDANIHADIDTDADIDADIDTDAGALLAQGAAGAAGAAEQPETTPPGVAERTTSFTRFDDGLELIAQLTPRLTGEFAIRRFLAADLDRAIADILPWTHSDDEHVRRLASEGTRPFLPWAIRVERLTASPEKTVPILDALRRDPSEYVRRSVANHLNDLSRHNPELVVHTAQRWLREPDGNTRWVVRHGLRTLVKKADPGALALLGFPEARVQVPPITVVDETVLLPGALDFSFAVTNDGDTGVKLAIDYIVYYVKSSGALAEKVFKLTTRDLDPQERIELRKRHAIHQMTTRVHYAGTHLIELQINGRRYSRRPFEVEIPLPLPPP